MSASLEKPSIALMQSRVIILLAVLAGLLPSTAAAAGVRFQARDEPVAVDGRSLSGLTRTLPPRRAPFEFDLAGIHWRGEGSVWFRTRPDGGRWSPWSQAMPEGDDLPDARSGEARRRPGWRLGNPWWTGSARWIQYRLSGEVTRLRAFFLWSPPVEPRRLAAAGAPPIVPRSGWEADEAIVRAPPSYAARLRLAIVHHTAGRNDYGPEESAAIVRGIEVYHVKANGWNDIGYNFLVDRYGQVFEGRAGGIDRNVVGAHARGFNTGSVGVAIIGNYQGEDVTPAATAALESLLAWRLDAAHVDPLSSPDIVAGGNERYSPGEHVVLRAISGHRDTGNTDCPGDRLYADLPAVAAAVAGTGLPKLYDPLATPSRLVPLGDGTYEPVALTARLSSPLPWSVTVTETGTGAVVASGSGQGDAVSWSWDGRGPSGQPVDPAGRYAATIAAADGALPAVVPLSAGPASPPPGALDVTALGVVPGVVTPNGDGAGDAAAISFTLAGPASVRVRLEDGAGAKVATIMSPRMLPAGETRVSWNGATQAGDPVPDGRYTVVVVAGKAGKKVSRSEPIVVDRTLGALGLSPPRFSPNGDGRRDVLAVSFDLTRPAAVQVLVRRGGRTVATLAGGETLPAGRQRLTWDGGAAAADGSDGRYAVVVDATTDLGTVRLTASATLDTTPPALSVLSAFSGGNATRVRFRLSEAARVKIWTDTRTSAVQRSAGTRTFSIRARTSRVRLRAWDAAGNASRLVRVSART